MKTVTKTLLVLILILLVSCATGEKFSSIREGMTKSEVSRILGNHDQLERKEGGWSTYVYRDRLLSGWSWDKTDYYVWVILRKPTVPRESKTFGLY